MKQKLINLIDYKTYLENEVAKYRGLNVELLYEELNDIYYKEGEIFDEAQQIFLLMSFNGYSIQKAQDIFGYQRSKTVTEKCSKYLFKFLQKLFELEKVKWSDIYTVIRDDGRYILPGFYQNYHEWNDIDRKLSSKFLQEKADISDENT